MKAGEILEVKLRDGSWLAGRYEWAFGTLDWPSLWVALDGDMEAEMILPAAAELRRKDAPE